MNSDARLSPLCTLTQALDLWLHGRVHLVSDQIGDVVRNGEPYVIFRHISVDAPNRSRAEPTAILKIRFRFSRGSSGLNKRLSLIPIPFIIGVPGFRSKVWMLGQTTGGFQGVYQWDTVEAAEAYMTSFAIRLMKRRAIPETLSHEIIEV